MSRAIDDLDPRVARMAREWLDRARSMGLGPLITCTRRTSAEQDALYAQGRTKPGKIVTNAKAGQSAHNFGLALDFVPLVHGKPEWSGKHPDWKRLGELAEGVGFEWAARWPRFKELPHIQFPNWKSYVQ